METLADPHTWEVLWLATVKLVSIWWPVAVCAVALSVWHRPIGRNQQRTR